MPVEPPIESPASLADAYALLTSSTADDQLTPIAGATDVMVRITGEIGEPPARMVDLSPFGLTNDNEVFYAADRPYGLIEGGVLREDAPDAGFAWE